MVNMESHAVTLHQWFMLKKLLIFNWVKLKGFLS